MVFIQYVINGLIIGGAYALIGIGLTLIMGIMNVVNFAHGEMYMLGAYFLFSFFAKMGFNFFFSMVMAIGSVMVIGFVFEKSILKPLRGRTIDTVMLSMIGLSIFMQNIAMILWSPVPESIKSPFPMDAIMAGPSISCPSGSWSSASPCFWSS